MLLIWDDCPLKDIIEYKFESNQKSSHENYPNKKEN